MIFLGGLPSLPNRVYKQLKCETQRNAHFYCSTHFAGHVSFATNNEVVRDPIVLDSKLQLRRGYACWKSKETQTIKGLLDRHISIPWRAFNNPNKIPLPWAQLSPLHRPSPIAHAQTTMWTTRAKRLF